MVRVRVWDLPLRCFHWALAFLVLVSLCSGLLGEKLGVGVTEWHARSGYGILALLLFRIVWGFCGGTQARFRSFVRGPRSVASYVRRALRGDREVMLGHNPAGGWSVMAMLVFLSLQAGSGLFIADEDLAFEAPLAKHISSHMVDLLKEFHEANAFLVLGLVGMHLAAIAYYYFAKGENLVRAMISGDKTLAAPPAEPMVSGHVGIGILVLAAAVTAVASLVKFA